MRQKIETPSTNLEVAGYTDTTELDVATYRGESFLLSDGSWVFFYHAKRA